MQIRKELVLSSKAKEEIAKCVIRDALGIFIRPAIVWSGGKDSTVVLHLVKQVTMESGSKLPPALFIDHGDHFPETMQIIEEVSKSWSFKVIIAKNEDVLKNVKEGVVRLSDLSDSNVREARKIGFDGDKFDYSLETDIGNHLLKTVAMGSALSKYRFDALFTGVRWDENPARSNEVFISPRERPPHARVQPILPMLEKDIWEYMFAYKLPVHPKYKEGYRSIDGIRDSKKVSDSPAWEQDMDKTSERGGRSRDKEDMMERLRQLGYM
ncbi:MAG: phosphoadenosine phosphosulfate reductase family protein [Nitrososphaerota archaeon]|nr:phosphoadenosine phosphosulfate reductase family protein [Nitrososphaerota archaeon]